MGILEQKNNFSVKKWKKTNEKEEKLNKKVKFSLNLKKNNEI